MSISNKKNKTAKLTSFNNSKLTNDELLSTRGGFLFRMLDDIRCSLERSTSRLFGGNGDGDW